MKETMSRGSEIVPTLFIGKWTVMIIYSLKKQPQRHGQLRRDLGNISQRMLTRTLRNLESAGLIARQVTRSRSVAVEYSLTKLGRTFIVPLGSICRWANRNKKELTAVPSFSRRTRSSPTQLDET
jgi:DNA-binding HxlR family transcriptional regulator